MAARERFQRRNLGSVRRLVILDLIPSCVRQRMSLFPISKSTEQEMDGEATMAAFATCSGPDCLKDVVSKYGSRVKVYNAIRVAINECYQQKVGEVACFFLCFRLYT